MFSIVLLSSCDQTRYISNGFSDNKPLIFENEYQCKNLKELNLEGSAFWGIPKSTELTRDAKHNSGRITTFNGVRIMGSSKLLPIIGMIGYSFVVGSYISVIAGQKTIDGGGYYINNVYFPNETYKNRISLPLGILMGLPIAGALNNLTFRNSALSAAGSGLNYKLIVENPDVDVFYYPKYEISNKVKFWTQKAYLKANVKGATQVLSMPKNNSNYSQKIISDATIKNYTKLSIDKNNFKSLKNRNVLMKNDEVILNFNKILYRGRFIKISKGKASVKNIEKKSDGKWIAVYEDYEKVYDFPSTTILGHK